MKNLQSFITKPFKKLAGIFKNLLCFIKSLPKNIKAGFVAFRKNPKDATKSFFIKLVRFIKKNYIEFFAFAILIVVLFPFYIVVINSAKPNTLITDQPLLLPDSFTAFFSNVSRVATNPSMRYFSSLFNSIFITTSSLILIGISSAMAAWVLVRTKTRLSMTIFLFIISGLVIPFQVVMIPLVSLLENLRAITGFEWKDTYHGVIIAYIGFGAPLSVFLFHGFIKSIALDIEEAAIIDGCNRPQVFFKIILPILKPIFVTLLVLNGLWIWNDFLLPLLVIGAGGSTQTLPLALRNLVGSYVAQYDLILTGLLMSAIPVIILFMFAQKYIISGMTSGAVK